MTVLKTAAKISRAALSALALGLLLASDAAAQVVGQLPASTGTVMAAAMETSGYKAQEMILSQLHGMLGNLASLIYIVCGLTGVISVVFTGGYRLGLWLLVSPALFYFTIDSRVTAQGVDWQFGAYQNQTGAVEHVLGYTNPQQGNSDVSWLFHEYNRLVSSVVQETIRVLTADQTKRQMKFMTRQQILDDLFASEPTDPGLWGLVKWTTGVCAQELQDARMVALGERDASYKDTPEYKDAQERLNNSIAGSVDAKNKPLHKTTGPLKYTQSVLDSLATMSDGNLDDYTNRRGSECLQDPQGYRYATVRNSGKLAQEAVSCRQLWCWMGIGLRQEASHALARSLDKHTQMDTSSAEYSEILQEIATKLHVCQKNATSEAERADGCVIDEEGKPLQTVNPDESIIPTIMAGYLLRKIMSTDRHSDMMTTFADHAGISGKAFNFNSRMDKDQRQQVGQRMRQHQMAMAKRAEVYSLAMTIPYLQGVLLYGLAMLFPFFALLLIIPGRAAAFFKWMALWFWVKSWDIGWAFVMIVDDVLWDLMPHHSKYDPLKDPNHGPITIFEQAFNGDPAYNLGFYYVMIGMLITSIPLLSAQLVLGGKTAMFGMLFDGLKGLADQFGAAMQDWTATEQAFKLDYAREASIAHYTSTNVEKEQMANKAAEEARRKAQEREERGSVWKWIGIGAAVAGLVVLTVATGGLAAVAVGATVGVSAATLGTAAVVGAGVALGGYAVAKGGLDIQRVANKQLAGITGANAELHFFNAGQLESSMMYDEMRSMVSERGEYWNMNPDASGALAYLEKQEAQAQQEETKATVGMVTEFATDVTTAVMAARGNFVK